MVEGFVFGQIDLAAVWTFPKEEGAVGYFGFQFGIFGDIDASIYGYFVLLPAFGAGGKCFVYDGHIVLF